MTLPPEYQVIIAGGGMTGASLACALAGKQARVAVIEAVPVKSDQQPSYDDRSLVLSLSSVRILKGLKLWDPVAKTANPVRHIYVSDRRHFGFVRLHAHELGLDVLGQVVVARELGKVLTDRLNSAGNIDVFCPATIKSVEIRKDCAVLAIKNKGRTKTLHTKLLVAADGTDSMIRGLLDIGTKVKNYEQTAIVTNVTPGRSHNDTAYERFTESGPLALLPLAGDRCAVVCTVKSDKVSRIMAMDDDVFLSFLQSRFGWRLGRLRNPGFRRVYPVKQVIADEQTRERVVLLGNSAHTIHPNAAQGFNLCLRDTAGLSEILGECLHEKNDPGDIRILTGYYQSRKKDQENIYRFTDGLARMFYNNSLHRIFFRNAGMLITDVCTPIKKRLMRNAIGLYGNQPHLVRGLSP